MCVCVHIYLIIFKIYFITFHRDIAATQGSAPFFKKCVEKVRTSKKCPVCTRGFDSQADVDKVITTVSNNMWSGINCGSKCNHTYTHTCARAHTRARAHTHTHMRARTLVHTQHACTHTHASMHPIMDLHTL